MRGRKRRHAAVAEPDPPACWSRPPRAPRLPAARSAPRAARSICGRDKPHVLTLLSSRHGLEPGPATYHVTCPAGRGCVTPSFVAHSFKNGNDNVRRVVAMAAADELSLIRFLYVDHGGVIRGKASSLSVLAKRIDTGIGDTAALMASSMFDTIEPVDGAGTAGEVRIIPDPNTFVTLPYAPGAGAMVADLAKPDGEQWDACSRTFLKEAIAELAREGYTLSAAFEPEFTLGHREADPAGGHDRLVPIDDSLNCSVTGFHHAHDYVIELVRALEAQGMQVQHYHPEQGHGQQEVSIWHAPALRAADNHVLYRETARGVAFRRGLWASFAPKPIPGQAGNGAHLHASLWSIEDDGFVPGEARNEVSAVKASTRPAQEAEQRGRNVFYNRDDRYGLAEIGYHFIGGLLAHLPALTALTCGSVNSYRRLAPRSWSSAYTIYGMDNREAAVRICSPLGHGSEGSLNLELRPSDSSANPYLALGAFIHAGLNGIRNELDPGKAVNVDPAALTDSQRQRSRAYRLPSSLAAALDALEADDILMDALGSLRSRAYLAVKRAEVELFAAKPAEFEYFHHFIKF